MSKTPGFSVKNVSKGPTALAAPGYPKIFIDAGKTHVFDDGRQYELYKAAAQGLKALGNVEITAGGVVDKVQQTPAIDAQEHKLAEAAAKSQVAPAPEAPAPAAEEEEEVEATAKPAQKAKPGKK